MRTFPWLTPDSLFSAWEHVRENAGCAGVDGITVGQFARSWKLKPVPCFAR